MKSLVSHQSCPNPIPYDLAGSNLDLDPKESRDVDFVQGVESNPLRRNMVKKHDFETGVGKNFNSLNFFGQAPQIR